MKRLPALRHALLFALAPGLLLACSTGGGGALPYAGDTADASADATSQTDATGGESDSTDQPPTDTSGQTQADTSTTSQDTGGTTVVPGDCTNNGFVSAREDISEVQAGVTIYQAITQESDPFDMLSFEFYVGGGYDGATGPGTIDLTGSNYETCADCVLVRSGCTQQGNCAKTFYADEGALVIERWSADTGFTGKLEGVVLKEVTIDDQTFVSTPVPGGETWCLDGYTFNAEVASTPTGGENTQATCVAEGTGAGGMTLINDNVADFSLPNCNGDMVSIHDGCGSTKALLFIGTAGWCTACHDLLAQLVTDHGGALSRAAVGDKTPGLDMLIVLGENQYGSAPSQDYCLAYAQDLKIDPAMVLIDHDTAGKDIPLIDPAGYAIEANSFATIWTHINPYLRAVGEEVATATPWMMLLRGSNMEYMWNDTEGPGTLDSMLGTLLAD